MRNSELQRRIADSALLVTSVGRQLSALLARLDQFSAGCAATGSGTGERVSGGGPESSTVEAAAGRRDQSLMARMEVEERLALAHGELQRLDRLCQAWLSPASRSRAGVGQPGCQWCQSHPSHLTDANGNLAERLPLCDWCRRWTVATGAKPSAAVIRAHIAGFKPRSGRKVA